MSDDSADDGRTRIRNMVHHSMLQKSGILLSIPSSTDIAMTNVAHTTDIPKSWSSIILESLEFSETSNSYNHTGCIND
ncbi:hypothetical protein JTB14_022263 [Gonioctena quinquepunctata]|nr:hypothetical protein JTB14_022263 [Gonioctena quinquepunctata]